MKVSDVLSLSTRMFRTNPMRTFLTILGLSVGIGAVLFLVSLGYGLQKLVLGNITSADSLLSLDVTPGAGNAITVSKGNIQNIAKIPHVDFVSPIVTYNSQVTINGVTGSTVANVVDSNFFKLSGQNVDYGQLPSANNTTGIIISSAGASLFGLSPKNIVGQSANISLLIPDSGTETANTIVSNRPGPFKIIGVIKDDSSNYIYFPFASLSDLNIQTFDELKIKISDAKYASSISSAVISQGFMVSSLSNIVDQTNKIFQIIQTVLAIFGLIALVVSAIGMMNTMTITLLERINEIGIMRAIGISKKDIKLMFLAESMIMGFLGGLGGIILGYVGGLLVNSGVNLLAQTFGGKALNLFYYPAWFVYFIIIFSTVIGLLTGIFPSIKASKLNPLSALRYK